MKKLYCLTPFDYLFSTVVFKVALKFCFHEHAFTENRKTLYVVTSLYEDFQEVLTCVSKESSDSAVLGDLNG